MGLHVDMTAQFSGFISQFTGHSSSQRPAYVLPVFHIYFLTISVRPIISSAAPILAKFSVFIELWL